MPERDVLFIGGEWRQPASRAAIEVVSPVTEEVIGRAPEADGTDVDAAVGAARRALDAGPWRTWSVEERVAVVERALQILEAKSAEIAEVVTSEMGTPIGVTEFLIPAAIGTARFFTKVAQSEPLEEVRRG